MPSQPQRSRRADSTPPQPARDLRPAPALDPVAEVCAAMAEHKGAQMLAEVDPENTLIEALLNASTTEAADILKLVTVDDLIGHMPAVVFTAIGQLTRTGRLPSPDAVAALARGPLGISPQPSHLAVVQYLGGVYTSRVKADPWAAAERVLEDSYRRSFATFGARMEQMADHFAPIEDLEQLTGTAVRHWRALRTRAHQIRACTRWNRLKYVQAPTPERSPATPVA